MCFVWFWQIWNDTIESELSRIDSIAHTIEMESNSICVQNMCIKTINNIFINSGFRAEMANACCIFRRNETEHAIFNLFSLSISRCQTHITHIHNRARISLQHTYRTNVLRVCCMTRCQAAPPASNAEWIACTTCVLTTCFEDLIRANVTSILLHLWWARKPIRASAAFTVRKELDLNASNSTIKPNTLLCGDSRTEESMNL